jgi:hypothetical protein
MNSDRYKRISDEPGLCKLRAIGDASAVSAETFVIVFKRRWPHAVRRLFSAMVLTFVFVTTCSLAVLVRPPAASEIKARSLFTDPNDFSATSWWQGPMYTFATQPK